MEFIAHRGAPFVAPENSLESFDRAIAEGADRIELDVHATRDGITVVSHDPTTERCGDAALSLGDAAFDDVRRIRLRNGEPIPTFAEACSVIRGRAEIDVELKSASRVMVERVIEELADHDLLAGALLTSFHDASLQHARSVGYHGRTGLLVGSRSIKPSQRLFEAWPLRAAERCMANALVIHHKLAYPLLVEKTRARGLALILWAAMEDEDDEARAVRAVLYDRMAQRAPDAIIVGRVAEARERLVSPEKP